MERRVYKKMAAMALCLLLAKPMFAQIQPPKPPKAPAHKEVRGEDFKTYWEEFDHQMRNLSLNLESLNLDKKINTEKLNQAMARVDQKLGKLNMDKLIKEKLEDLPPLPPLKDFDFDMRLNLQDPAADNYTQGAEKSRTITKTYAVGDKDKLAIDNQYGNVNVNVWAKKEIKVDVEIKAYEATDAKAQDLLESVSVAESRQSNLISFKTNFEKNSTNFWIRIKGGKEERRGIQVNYTIYMPANNPLDITNRYGNTNLPDFSGPVSINSSYGSLTAQKLNNPANRVKVSYGSVKIDDFSSGNLDVAYGNLNLGRGDKLNANIRYGSSKIGRITTSANIELSYAGGFKIDQVDKNVKSLVINSAYSGLSLGIDEAANFDFDVTVSYAGFSYKKDGKINITRKSPDDDNRGWQPTKNYQGYFGKSSDSRIIIKSSYGGVKFL